ncbi:MAG TPA: transposase [Solirubrobacteraceae bacterium]|nr:transposase [Solirubrobacteraceae bacterium]
MAQKFLSCDRDQVMLLPPDMAEWLPEGHLARFVIEVVDQLDLSAIYGWYRVDGHGRPAHDPAMMTALLLFNYSVGVCSSRAIERRCVEDVACRVLAANRRPDHATIARFRVRHQAELSELFFQVLELCKDAGMVRVGTVAVDSTKLAANASLGANRTHQQLRLEAERLLGQAAETDAREDDQFGECRGDELPEDLADPGTRAARIGELLERARKRVEKIEAERTEMLNRRAEHETETGKRPRGRRPGEGPDKQQRRVLEREKYNLTDPDSKIVSHRGMLIQGYNVQTAVSAGQIILAIRAGDGAADPGQLAPTVADAIANLRRVGIDERIKDLLADRGYWHTQQILDLQKDKIRVLVPPSNGRARSPERMSPEAQKMNQTLASEDGKAAYLQRQQIVEPVFAQTKHHRGITRILRRGREAVQAELDLIATTHNLLKLYRNPQTA